MIPSYKLECSTDMKEIGDYPQIQEFSKVHNKKAQFYYSPDETGKFPANAEFPIYRMQSKAKLTDLVSNAPLNQQLMISNKCLALFKTMNIPAHQYFPLKFMYNGKMIESYFSFSLDRKPHYLEKYVSWKHSRFYATLNYHRDRIKEYKLENLEEWKRMKKEIDDDGEFGFYSDIRLKYDENFDLLNFDWYPLPYGYVCTERLVNKIADEKLTGFKFEPLSPDLFVDV